jgi:hypothetical protein
MRHDAAARARSAVERLQIRAERLESGLSTERRFRLGHARTRRVKGYSCGETEVAAGVGTQTKHT